MHASEEAKEGGNREREGKRERDEVSSNEGGKAGRR